jgi:hypothetical protein
VFVKYEVVDGSGNVIPGAVARLLRVERDQTKILEMTLNHTLDGQYMMVDVPINVTVDKGEGDLNSPRLRSDLAMGGDGRLSPLYDWYDPRFVDRVRALFRNVVEVEALIEAVKLVRMSSKDECGDLLLSLAG